MKIKLSSIQMLFTNCLLLLFLLAPFQLQLVKLALVLSIISISIISKELFISKKCIIWNICFTLFNGFYLLIAFVRNNPAATHFIPTYILWPILFTLLSGTIAHDAINKYIKTIQICLIFDIILGVFAFVSFNITLQPDATLLSFSAGLRPGYPFIVISSPIITVFLFFYFFFFALYFISSSPFDKKKIIFLLLGIIFIFATSRRVLFVNFGVSIILIALFNKYFPNNAYIVKRRIIKSIVGISLFIICAFLILISNGLMETDAMSDFMDKTSEVSDGQRVLQTKALIEGWLKNPLMGAGPGIDADVSRSEVPGIYELSYLAKLFEVGLLGMVIYIGFWIMLFYWTFKTGCNKFLNAKIIIALLCAMTIFLIGNATNPYLSAFDYLWFLYIPFVAINLNDKYKIHAYC